MCVYIYNKKKINFKVKHWLQANQNAVFRSFFLILLRRVAKMKTEVSGVIESKPCTWRLAGASALQCCSLCS